MYVRKVMGKLIGKYFYTFIVKTFSVDISSIFLQTVEDSVVYSSTTFTWRKTDKVEQRSSRKAEEKTVYTGVRDL